jgi:hypothetical protein
MDFKMWSKGLGVFVASAFVTSLAAVNLSPSTFNFTKAGLAKLGSLVLIIGVKAVLLYLKKSPLTVAGQTVGGQAGFARVAALQMALPAVLVFSLVVAPVMITTGCSVSSAQVVAGIQDVESKLPQIAQIASGILIAVAPEDLALVQPVVALLKTGGGVLSDAITAYQKDPSATTLQKVNAAVQSCLDYTNQLASLPGIKNTNTQAIVTGGAGLLGLIFNDVASWVQKTPAAVVSRLPAMFGWHIAGVDLVGIDGSKLPAPAAGKTKHSGFTARDIAAHWNKLVKNEQAKIHEARKHVMGIPIPGTGHK